jgi:hypothetical protein
MDGRNSMTRPWTASRLWLWWIAATTAGVAVAFAAFIAIFSIIGDPGGALFPVIMTGFGLAIGMFQQRVLRRGLADARRWALATAIGLGTGIALAVIVGLGGTSGLAPQIAQGAVAGAVAGGIIGMLQWLVLRSRIPGARWWVASSIAGWAAGAAVGDGVAYFVQGLDVVIAPIIAASVTGIALVAFLRSQEDTPPKIDTPRYLKA